MSIRKNKRKVGIEHASQDDIKQALSAYRHTSKHHESNLTIQDLYDLKLIGHPQAKQRRQALSESLGIGLANGKTLLRKLHMFGLDLQDILPYLSVIS